jgi:hypothetical protein
MDSYVATLEAFSKPVSARTSWNPDTPDIPPTGNDAVYFRYFDATAQTEFLCWALQRTIEHDLDHEISFLRAYDKASKALGTEMDWPAHSLSLFIRVVEQNDFKLSNTKRSAHFSWMSDEEVANAERVVQESFAGIPRDG